MVVGGVSVDGWLRWSVGLVWMGGYSGRCG